MLLGLSPFAELENSRVEGSMGRLQKGPRRPNVALLKKWSVLRSAALFASVLHDEASTRLPLDEQDMVREVEGIAASISQLRKRHETFQPINSKEAARQQLFGDAAERETPLTPAAGELSPGRGPFPRSQGVKKLSPEAQLERWELLKYVRKIEPDLPPLERPPPCSEPPPNQALVEFNASAAALQRWSPDVRSRLVAMRSAEHTAHIRGVAKHAVEVKAAALARKREIAEQRVAGPTRTVLSNLRNAASQWLVICAVASFTQNLAVDVRLKRMRAQERDDYISQHWQRLQRRKLPEKSMTRKLVLLVQLSHSPAFQERVPLLGCFFTGKLRLRKHRNQASQIATCLHAWKSAGVMFLTLRRIGVHVKRLQRWWRKCLMRVKQIRSEVSRRWLIIEHNQLDNELRSLLPWAKPEDNPVFEAKIEKMRIPEAVRLKFIEHELRARRFFLLPHIYLWEEDTRKWQREVQEWRATCGAIKVVNNGGELDIPGFHWPPSRPSHLPNDLDIHKMWSTARNSPEGWTHIPRCVATGSRGAKQKAGGGALLADDDILSRATSRALQRPRRPAVCASADDEVEAYLQRLGIGPAFMPGGLAKPLPPTAECEDD